MILEEKISRRKRLGNLRKLSIKKGPIDFASNDYLGLARFKNFQKLVLSEFEKINSPLHGFGSTGSRLLTGNHSYIEELEKSIALFHGFEDGLLFTSGYMANCGLLQALQSETLTIFYDSLIHASMKDGITLSKAQSFPFRHNDVNHLEERLKKAKHKNIFVLIESVYSTDGSISPLEEIVKITSKYQANLIVDEAHAAFIYGPEGKGFAFEHREKVFAQIITFGKALGVHGAIVLGSKKLKRLLLNFAKTAIFTTSLPLISFCAIKCAYSILPTLENERAHLKKLIHFFKKHIQTGSETAIQPVRSSCVQEQACKLEQKGFDVSAIMSPTVRRGFENLRIILHSYNREEEISLLCAQLL